MKDIEAGEWHQGKAEQFAAIYLLHQIDEKAPISIILDKDYQFIEPLLDKLHGQNYIDIADAHYQLSGRGAEALQRFNSRYREYLRVYDIFSAVNLHSGEFAFAKYFDFTSDEAWYKFLDNENWADLRLAVARLKKLDAHEIVFMSFLNEGRFGADANGWQFDLILGSIWDEIRSVCRNAITVDELGGEQRLLEFIRKGSTLLLELLEHEQKLQSEERRQNEGQNDSQTEREMVADYEVSEEFYLYRDPFYVSPFWVAPLLFL